MKNTNQKHNIKICLICLDKQMTLKNEKVESIRKV